MSTTSLTFRWPKTEADDVYLLNGERYLNRLVLLCVQGGKKARNSGGCLWCCCVFIIIIIISVAFRMTRTLSFNLTGKRRLGFAYYPNRVRIV